MNVRDLGVTIKANIKGLDNLKAFNNELKATLGLIKRIKNTKFNLQKATEEASKSLSETESTESSSNNEGRKSGRVGLLLFLKNLKSAPIIASLIYIGRAVMDVTKKVASLVISLSQVSYETLKLSRNLGVSTDSLQRFGNLAVAQGVKLSDFQSAISSLRKMSADIMLGRGDISPFAILGINPHQDPEKILIQLQQRLKQLPEAVGTAFASDLGLSPDMINFVRRTDFGRLARQPKLSASELKTLEDMRSSALEFLNLLTVLGQKALAFLSPVVKLVLVPINNLLRSITSNTMRLRWAIVNLATAFNIAVAVINPALGGVLLTLEALGLIMEDLVKTGGKGFIAWVIYSALVIKKALSEIWDNSDFNPKNTWELEKKRRFTPDATPFTRALPHSEFYRRIIPKEGEEGKKEEKKESVDVSFNGSFYLRDAFNNILDELNVTNTNTTVSGVYS